MNRPVHVILPCLARYDAIGNDAVGMVEALRDEGYSAKIFVEASASDLDHVTKPLDPESAIWQDPAAILIYHHSTAWPRGEQLLVQTRNQKIIKYHNVTPPEFFRAYSKDYFDACRQGVEATKRLATTSGGRFWSDSVFNTMELITLGAPASRCHTLPPFHRIETLQETTPNLGLYHRLEGKTTILFTGGIKPNKGHRLAIQSFAHYHYLKNRHSVLLFAGVIDERLQSYFQELQNLTSDLGLEDSIIFTGPLDEGQLKTCYQLADVFLCNSEHEGFCVPLVEAMAFRVPIVASANAAVPETIGDVGLVFADQDPRVFAEAIDFLVERPDIHNALGQKARERFEQQFSCNILRRRLLHLLEDVENHIS